MYYWNNITCQVCHCFYRSSKELLEERTRTRNVFAHAVGSSSSSLASRNVDFCYMCQLLWYFFSVTLENDFHSMYISNIWLAKSCSPHTTLLCAVQQEGNDPIYLRQQGQNWAHYHHYSRFPESQSFNVHLWFCAWDEIHDPLTCCVALPQVTTDNFMTVRFHYEMLLPSGVITMDVVVDVDSAQTWRSTSTTTIPTWQFTRGGNSKTVYRLVERVVLYTL